MKSAHNIYAMIKLWFNNAETPELTKLLFHCPITGRERWSYRGRGSWRGDGSFPWTTGVKALCSLLLSTRLNHVGISGDKGSLAASLDFALGKPPAWLQEMFGQLPNGSQIVSKLFVRLNPEGKRMGPFEVRVNQQVISPEQIQVFINGNLCETANIHFLHSQLTEDVPFTEVSSLLTRPDFVQAVDSHMIRSYGSIDIFTQSGRDAMLKRIYDHPGFKKYAPLGSRVTHHVDDALMNRERLGIVNSDVRTILRTRSEPIRLSSNMPTIPINVLFRYMARIYNIPMEIDFSYFHAAEVGKQIAANGFTTPPDLCVMGLGPTAAILSLGDKTDYRPITPLPASYDELLSGNSSDSMTHNSGFSFIDDFPSTPRLFFERLTDAKKINSNLNPVIHLEPADSIAMTLQERNARTILFFPYNIVARLFYGLHQDSSLEMEGNITDMILLGKKEFLSNESYLKAFLIAMRDTWLRLRSDPTLQRSLRDELLATEEYKRIFTRAVEIPFKIAA